MRLKDRSDVRSVEYFDAVRRRLLDIPWSQRHELLTQLATRLDELAGRRDPEAVLGEPGRYAALMRESAGYGPRPSKRFAYVRAWRLRTKIALATIVVVATAGAITARAVTAYQPIEASLYLTYSSARQVQSDVPTNTQYWYSTVGAPVVVGFTVHNHGRFTATVTGTEQDPAAPIQPAALRATRDDTIGGEWQRAPEVSRVAIHPGETVNVFVVMKMVPWQVGPGTFVGQDLPALDIEVLGTRHVVPVAGDKIGVAGAPG